MGAGSSPVDFGAATSPEGSVVGTFADSEAVSSGPQARASLVAFPLIARIAGGSGWSAQGAALEGLCFQGAWDT